VTPSLQRVDRRTAAALRAKAEGSE
jgi:hypothetical protein